MEGLIPTFFKAVRKNKTRKQYECLSAGAAHSFNIADFYINGETGAYTSTGTSNDRKIRTAGLKAERINGHHRRSNSVGDFSVGFSPGIDGTKKAAQKQIVRSRSHRIFSCVTGN
ncbi:uncharacterized protein LOC119981138 [Tripterygium wilfordii]|uniref:uncharacterized protein LOC119981138 n=1 Tax=Tripterygium wilfordii TaxID=458696 RepID=UPI0018F806C9|nr:uncharacterized protein LOC119981138 [Tripterygium wilfordii]